MREHAEGCYLIGLAAECGLKYHLATRGLLGRARANRRKIAERDILYLHFPDLATQVLLHSERVISARVIAVIGSFSQNWHVKMRYQDAKSDTRIASRLAEWKSETLVLFEELGI